MGVSQNRWFILYAESHYSKIYWNILKYVKMDDLGVPPWLRKPPILWWVHRDRHCDAFQAADEVLHRTELIMQGFQDASFYVFFCRDIHYIDDVWWYSPLRFIHRMIIDGQNRLQWMIHHYNPLQNIIAHCNWFIDS